MRNGWFAWCNFICMFIVVRQHLPYASDPPLIQKLVLLVIPLFAIIAGCSWGWVLKKTKGKGVLPGLKFFIYPYLFWLVIYYLYQTFLSVCVQHQDYRAPRWELVVSWVFNGQTFLPLYYIVTLIYVMLASLATYNFFSRKNLFYVLSGVTTIVMLIAHSVDVQYLESYSLYPVLDWICRRFCLVVSYFMMGVLFSSVNPKRFAEAPVKLCLPFVWILGIVVFAFSSRGYNAAILICAIMMTMLAFPDVHIPQLVKTSAPYIMGIYLAHGLLTIACWKVMWLKQGGERVIFFPYDWLLSVAFLFITWGVVWLMRRMPALRAVV